MANLARGERLCGRYTLFAKIGVGGHAEVWRARDSERGIEVALKILRPDIGATDDAWAVLEHEYVVTSRLDHPGILKVHAPVRCDGFSLLPMDFARGGDLARLRGKSYSLIVPALIEVAQALEHAHARGVVHRDLKPGNVLLGPDDRALIADFGVASLGDSSPFADHGSPFSASPQALRGEPPTPSDDIYGLGTLAYELLGGYPPFYPRFEPRRVLEEPVPDLAPLETAPPRLCALIMRMLAKRSDMRPRSMREVVDELHATLHDTLVFDINKLPDAAPKAGPPQEMNAGVDTLSDYAAHHEARDEAVPPLPHLPDAPMAATPAAAEWPALRATDEPVEYSPFDEINVDAPTPMQVRRHVYREKKPMSRGVTVLIALAAFGAMFAVFAWLPRFAPNVKLPTLPKLALPKADDGAAEAAKSLPESIDALDARLLSLEQRGAAVWGGPEFAAARSLASEARIAADMPDVPLALDTAKRGSDLATALDQRADKALADQLQAGEAALVAGQAEPARQAFTLASQIDPTNAPAKTGLGRADALEKSLPVLADAANAEAAGDFAGAAQRYDKVLQADPQNAAARAGRERVRSASSNDTYSKTLANGFEALRAGRMDEARAAFDSARALRPTAKEPAAGLVQVDAATVSAAGASAKEDGLRFEAEERWSEALGVYDGVLRVDQSVQFAREGFDRAAPRAELGRRLQLVIDRPERLSAPDVRSETDRLLERARGISAQGPVLRSQIARLEILLLDYDKPVRVVIESDALTTVTVQRIGPLGTFQRRELELKPGRYTVTGARLGYRDVRRDIVVAPGSETQSVAVSCVEPVQAAR